MEAIIGSLSLGIVIGWLTRYFIRRYEKVSVESFTGTISVISGALVDIAAIYFLDITEKNAIWYYFMGLLIGFIIYQISARKAIQFESPTHESLAKTLNGIGKELKTIQQLLKGRSTTKDDKLLNKALGNIIQKYDYAENAWSSLYNKKEQIPLNKLNTPPNFTPSYPLNHPLYCAPNVKPPVEPNEGKDKNIK